jgi:outer membrane protein OmpA-like peptidoglycan-associated protein
MLIRQHTRFTRPAPLGLLLSLAALAAAEAQAPPDRIPMGTGATIVQTLSAVGADRESVHRVRLASDSGLHYEWLLEEVHDTGDTLRQEFRYLEAWADLAGAKRLRFFHDAKAPEAHPGYTMHALSRATYRRLREGKPDSVQVMSVDEAPGSAQLQSLGFGGGRSTPVRWRGTLAPSTPGTVPFPVLLNGRRVQLRAFHLRGDFTARQGRWQPQLWVLADSAYPLILKWIGAFRETGNVLQTTRIDLPLELVPADGVAAGDGVLLVGREGLGPSREAEIGTGAGAAGAAALERELAGSCRVELPGIYFAFNSAHLAPASDRAIATLADVLTRHSDWTATLEGHTDSIGSAAANKVLSERRVEAVRARLVEQYKVDSTRLRVAGHGAARPREPNATIEGRARNRRVELVRDCDAPAGAAR